MLTRAPDTRTARAPGIPASGAPGPGAPGPGAPASGAGPSRGHRRPSTAADPEDRADMHPGSADRPGTATADTGADGRAQPVGASARRLPADCAKNAPTASWVWRGISICGT